MSAEVVPLGPDHNVDWTARELGIQGRGRNATNPGASDCIPLSEFSSGLVKPDREPDCQEQSSTAALNRPRVRVPLHSSKSLGSVLRRKFRAMVLNCEGLYYLHMAVNDDPIFHSQLEATKSIPPGYSGTLRLLFR